MCEFCEKSKDVMFNRPIDSSLFIGKHGRMIWRLNGFKNNTLVAYAKINYCPMCGRKL